MSSMSPGWYPDPFSSGGYVRWWDGERWGQSTAVQPGDSPPPPPGAAARPFPGPMPGGGSTGVDAAGGANLASYGQRVVAYLLDGMVQGLVLVPLVMWLEWPVYQDLSAALDANGGQLTQAMLDTLVQRAQQNSLWVTIATLVVTALYAVPQVALYGRTLGKRVVGLRVQSSDGAGVISWRQSLLRWMIQGAGWLICSLLLLIDLLWPLWDRPLRQAIHDKAARTIVIRDRG